MSETRSILDRTASGERLTPVDAEDLLRSLCPLCPLWFNQFL